jgi:hypothetical protein
VSAGADPGPGVVVPRGSARPRQGLTTASGSAAVLTGAVAIWVAFEIRIAGPGWLPWVACALPPAAAGALCLARRRVTTTAPAAVFASCTAAGAYAVQIPSERTGLVLAASVVFLLCAGVAVVISAIVTAVMITSGAVSRRRAAVWTAAGLMFAALSIPSPVYVTGGPIQTIFTGNTRGEDAAAICSLVLLAVPLVVAGLADARIATVIAVAWLPEAAAQPLGWYVFWIQFLHLDVWYYVSWLA